MRSSAIERRDLFFFRRTEESRKSVRPSSGTSGSGHVGVGYGSGDRCFSAVRIGRMNLDQGIAEVAQFDVDGAIRGGDGFSFASEGSAFDPFKTKTKGSCFTKNQGGKLFRIFGKGEDCKEITRASFFH